MSREPFETMPDVMEAKRLGLCKKSLFVVPNHLTEQWGGDFLTLYPGAKVLVATKKDFEPKNRKKFCARIATGDYDAVIIGHSQFEKIPLSPARQEAAIESQLDEIMEAIEEAKREKAENFTVKQLERTRKNLEARLKRLHDKKKDDVVTFEELGVDRLFVDEAHYYKNLYFSVRKNRIIQLSPNSENFRQKSMVISAALCYTYNVSLVGAIYRKVHHFARMLLLRRT